MEILKSFFRFTSRERLAMLLLCLLMVIFWTLPLFFPEKPPKIGMVQPQQAASATRGDSLLNRVASTSSKGGSSIDPSLPSNDAASSNTKKLHYFYFNPNTISPEQWQRLGLRDKTILTIQHYLQKGGSFKKPEDLRKIWGLKAWEADLLIPYVQIPAPDHKIPASNLQTNTTNWQISTKDQAQQAAIAAGKQASPENKAGTVKIAKEQIQFKPAYQHKTWQIVPIEINAAGPEQWMAFPGIGSVLASRIVKFREKIGGFTSIEQVGKTYGIKDSLFQLMKPLLILENPSQKKE